MELAKEMKLVKSLVTANKISITLYIANRAFSGLRKLDGYVKQRQAKILILKTNKLNIKIFSSAQWQTDTLSVSTTLLSIY